MRYAIRIVLGVVLVAGACAPDHDAAPEPSWRELALVDLDFIHAQLGEHHPGPVDTLNPWFRDWYMRGYEEARRRAESIDNHAGYYFAIQYYMVGFQDGHLGALSERRLDIDLERRWPGFVVGYSGGAFRVLDGGLADVPPAGARLVSCDGTPAATLADSILRPYVGLWSVNGVRPRLAPWLLIDEGNPWVRHPDACVFETEDGRSEWPLAWRPVDRETLGPRLEAAAVSRKPPIGIREFDDRMWWITLSSVNASDSVVVRAIDEIVGVIEARRSALRGAEVIVFDVRGNQGGSSTLGRRVVSAVWGEDVIAALPARWTAVDWRVSADNAGFLRRSNLARLERRVGADAPAAREYRELVEAMEAAVERGDLFHRVAADRSDAPASAANPVRARVFLLTDTWCASACLDFADLVLAMDGVTHVGAETGADAVYIDNRSARLPSGQGRLGFSMKVYRDRVRGHNVSYVPSVVWDGSMADDAALERWIMSLAVTGD